MMSVLATHREVIEMSDVGIEHLAAGVSLSELCPIALDALLDLKREVRCRRTDHLGEFSVVRDRIDVLTNSHGRSVADPDDAWPIPARVTSYRPHAWARDVGPLPVSDLTTWRLSTGRAAQRVTFFSR